MGNVTLQKFYPENGTVDATEVNNNYNAINGSTGGINDENVASEGLIREHFNFSPAIKYADYQENGYYLAEGATAAADAQYHSLTDTGIATGNKTVDANKEQEINHNSSGVAATQQGTGTKIPVGGLADSQNSNGITLEVGDVLHVFWNVTAWRFVPDNSTLTNYVCELIDSSSVRSTILNYAMVVYPKFNTQDSLGSNLNFEKPDDSTHGFSDDEFRNPPDGVAALGGGGGVSDPLTTGLNNLSPFADKRHDHWTWIPVMMGSAGSVSNDETIAVMMDAENGASDVAIGEQKNCAGQTFIKVDTQKTLYSIQLYVSGLYSTHFDTGTEKNNAFIEDQAVTNASGGIDGSLHIERASIGYVIYRKEAI